MEVRRDLVCILRRRVTAAGFLINLAGALSLAVYMLVVYPASDAAGILSDLWVGFGAVTLYNTVAGLSAYRTARPWFDEIGEWLARGGPPTPHQCRLALAPAAPPDARSLGIGPRLVLTWVLCSGVPILMLALIPVSRDVEDPDALVAPTLFAAGMALVT